MPKRPSLAPPPRMKRRLMATIHSPTGLMEGEAWWMDEAWMVMVSPERYAEQQTVEIRLDLGGFHGHVDVEGLVHEASHHPAAQGYAHTIGWRARSYADEARVVEVLATINPASIGPAEEITVPVRPSRPPAEPLDSTSTTGPSSQGLPRELAWRHQRDEESGRKRPVPPQPPPTTVPIPPVPARPRRDRPPPSRGPPPPDVQFHWGPPASLYVSTSTPAQLAAATRIVDEAVYLVLPPVAGAYLDDDLVVALRLPTGAFVELRAIVREERRTSITLEGCNVPADVRATLRAVLDLAGRQH